MGAEEPTHCGRCPRNTPEIQRRKDEAMKLNAEPGRNIQLFVPSVRILRPLTDDNPRLVSQRGLFTWSDSDIEDWVWHQYRGVETAVLLRIWLPEDERGQALKALKRMNISHLTLFPDLEGASRYCNMELEVEGY